MLKRITYLLLLTSLFLVVTAWAVQAADISVNVNLNFDFPALYPDCPVPSHAVVVRPERKHYGNEWTEYQVDYSSRRMILIYQEQMPQNGWHYVRESDGVYYWSKGRRLMRVSVIWIGPHRSVVAFSETKIRPDKGGGGYKDRYYQGRRGKKHSGGYKD